MTTLRAAVLLFEQYIYTKSLQRGRAASPGAANASFQAGMKFYNKKGEFPGGMICLFLGGNGDTTRKLLKGVSAVLSGEGWHHCARE
ncbi:MAG: hypothetical protein AVO39_10905 [delta proteobacterium MLS_D]|nr:MAG: hypothetical protein AVO39_10905 [delta proteobacterium MLS_D]